MKSHYLLMAYALTNVILYSSLLPLWEGFDEPFHFGYIQDLASGNGFPDPRTSRLSQELASSILLAPASASVQRNLPGVTTYADFFGLPEFQREPVRSRLAHIGPNLRSKPSQILNYEGLQAPLAYAVLALPERAAAQLPLALRVLALRMIAGALAALLLYFASLRLSAQLNIGSPYRELAIFCVFSSQMIWATVAHVANDWLAVPLSVWLLVTAIDYANQPGVRRAVLMSAVLAAGLLTKAYFIAFVAVPLSLCLFRRRWLDLGVSVALVLLVAGPWYVRNWQRYNTVSGMQELRNGTDPTDGIRALQVERLPAAVEACARAALWTGNNTFRAFSVISLRLLLAVWLAAMLLWAVSRHGIGEWITMLHSGLFLLALAYNAAINYAASHGEVASPAPWYSQVLLVPLLALATLGTSRSQRVGRLIAIALTAASGYILLATYWAKLIPLYGGFDGRTSLSAIVVLYTRRMGLLAAGLDDLCLVRAEVILLLACVVSILAVALTVILVRQLAPRRVTSETAACRPVGAD